MEETRRVGFEVKLYEAFYTLFFILNQKLIIFLFSFLDIASCTKVDPQCLMFLFLNTSMHELCMHSGRFIQKLLLAFCTKSYSILHLKF